MTEWTLMTVLHCLSFSAISTQCYHFSVCVRGRREHESTNIYEKSLTEKQIFFRCKPFSQVELKLKFH